MAENEDDIGLISHAEHVNILITFSCFPLIVLQGSYPQPPNCRRWLQHLHGAAALPGVADLADLGIKVTSKATVHVMINFDNIATLW